jgi:iron complex transport system substrate-binding protein
MRLRRHSVVIAVSGVLLLGCGATDPPAIGTQGEPAALARGETEVDATDDGADVEVVRIDHAPLVTVAAPAPRLPATIIDAHGHEVTVTDTSRILPLVGSVTEIVFSLGLGDQVVGRDVGSSFPEAGHLPVVTDGHQIDVEGVLSLRPTVVLADTWVGPPEAIEQLRASRVPVVVLDEAWTLDDVAPRIERVAAALGVPDAGHELIEATVSQIEQAASASDDDAGPRVAFLYLRGTAGVYLIGGAGSGADALIEAAGAVDAGVESGLERPFTPITSEALIAAQPDVLLVMTGGLESVGGIDGLVELPGIAQTPAARDRRVIAVDDALLLSFGPRTGAVVAQLARGLGTAGPT